MKIKEKRIISEKENNQSLVIQQYSVNNKIRKFDDFP